MFREGKRTDHKNRLSKWPIADVRDLYEKLVRGRSGLLIPPTAEEEAAGELLDEERRRQELREIATPNLQAIVARDFEKESLDERLALEILAERQPTLVVQGD